MGEENNNIRKRSDSSDSKVSDGSRNGEDPKRFKREFVTNTVSIEELTKPTQAKDADYSDKTEKEPEKPEENKEKDTTDEPEKSVGGSVLPNKVFCGGLSWSTSEEGLKLYFSKYGEVSEVVLMRDRVTGKPRGFAFVSFLSAEAVAKATEKHMHEIDGKNVEVKNAFVKGTNAPRESQSRDRAPVSMNSCKLFVGGLAAETIDKDLDDYFSKFGDIAQVVVMRDSQTNRNRGFGFVTYKNQEDADKALSYKRDHIVSDKRVDVKSYKGRQGGGGGGNGGSNRGHEMQNSYSQNRGYMQAPGYGMPPQSMYGSGGGGYGQQNMYYMNQYYQNVPPQMGMDMQQHGDPQNHMMGYHQQGYYQQHPVMQPHGQGYDSQHGGGRHYDSPGRRRDDSGDGRGQGNQRNRSY